jgi:hypothetical protein
MTDKRVDQLLDKLAEMLAEKAKLEEENAYLAAQLQHCEESV